MQAGSPGVEAVLVPAPDHQSGADLHVNSATCSGVVDAVRPHRSIRASDTDTTRADELDRPAAGGMLLPTIIQMLPCCGNGCCLLTANSTQPCGHAARQVCGSVEVEGRSLNESMTTNLGFMFNGKRHQNMLWIMV